MVICADNYVEVRRAEAHRFKLRFCSAVGVQGCPSRGILKQANRSDLPICAQIEPMPRAAWDANQVSGFHFNRCDGASVTRMNVKHAVTGENESDFIFIMPVLAAELCRASHRGPECP